MNTKHLTAIYNLLLDLKYTLIDSDGLDNITDLLQRAKRDSVQGGFLEAGVWRGGACIWARIVMDKLGMNEPVWVCDSFKGLPFPNKKDYPKDEGDDHFMYPELSVSLNSVKENFDTFPLKGEVKFREGFFVDTMPKIKEEIDSICILRVDADMYEGTIQVLENLYDKVSPKGYVICDDYGLPRAKMAIDDFRKAKGIESPMIQINNIIWYWQKI